jgi:hypothetical protein
MLTNVGMTQIVRFKALLILISTMGHNHPVPFVHLRVYDEAIFSYSRMRVAAEPAWGAFIATNALFLDVLAVILCRLVTNPVIDTTKTFSSSTTKLPFISTKGHRRGGVGAWGLGLQTSINHFSVLYINTLLKELLIGGSRQINCERRLPNSRPHRSRGGCDRGTQTK